MLNIVYVSGIYIVIKKEAPWGLFKGANMAKATSKPQFKRIMQNLKEIDESSWKELNDLKASLWTKLAYETYTQCDL